MPTPPVTPPSGPFGPGGLPLPAGSALDDVFAIGGFGANPAGGNPLVIDGQGGNDVVDFTNFNPTTPGAGIVVTAGASGLRFSPGPGANVGLQAVGIEHVIGSAFADDITASAGILSLLGGGGNDVLHGMVGITLDGGSGDDTYDVGAHLPSIITDTGGGMDTVDLSRLTQGVNVDFVAGKISAGLEHASMANVERIISTPFGDFVVGGAGNEIIDGGAGNDSLDGGAGSDTLDYSSNAANGGAAAVGVYMSANIAVDGFGNFDMISNFENVVGSDVNRAGYNDVILGNGVANYIDARAGGDIVVAGDNDDIVYGGLGTDAVFGDNGNDTLVGSNFAAAFNGEIDFLLGGAGNDTLYTGTAGIAFMDGGAGNDRIFGGSAGDYVVSGSGSDTVTLGAGVDLAIIYASELMAGEYDVFTDFTDGYDFIYASASLARSVTFGDTGNGAAYMMFNINGGMHTTLFQGVTAAQISDQVFFNL